MPDAELLPKSSREAASSEIAYAPYAVLSLAALGVAVLFAVLLVFFGVSAKVQQQSFIMPELLIISLSALVLAFAARRQILNSEGTRIGLRFCNAAWWIAVVGSTVLLAVLVGSNVAIRKGSQNAFDNWSKLILKASPLDARGPDLVAAFHGTMPPEKQGGIQPTEIAKIEGLFGPGLVAFRQCDLVRTAFRNPGAFEFEIGGLEHWVQKGPKLECRLTVKARCPEGEFTMSVALANLKEPGKPAPVWQVVPPTKANDGPPQFFVTARLSEYGERIRDLERAAHQTVYEHILGSAAFRQFNNRLLDEMAAGGDALKRLRDDAALRTAAFGGGAAMLPEPANFDDLAKKHFVPADRGNAEKEDQQRKDFARVWKSGLIGSPGMALGKTPDTEVILVPLAGGAWEARVPVELQTSRFASTTAARGVVVLTLDDAATIAELNALREKKGELTPARPKLAPAKPVPWRFSRIESDMQMQSAPRQAPGPDQ